MYGCSSCRQDDVTPCRGFSFRFPRNVSLKWRFGSVDGGVESEESVGILFCLGLGVLVFGDSNGMVGTVERGGLRSSKF
jgi:hypothetical protein